MFCFLVSVFLFYLVGVSIFFPFYGFLCVGGFYMLVGGLSLVSGMVIFLEFAVLIFFFVCFGYWDFDDLGCFWGWVVGFVWV